MCGCCTSCEQGAAIRRAPQGAWRFCRLLICVYGQCFCGWGPLHAGQCPPVGKTAVRDLFRGAPASGAVDALRGYQNEDGGFGQALESDIRCPDSLPVYVEVAFQALVAAGTLDRGIVQRACDYLARVALEADADGAVPPAFPVIESFPRASHWTEWTYEPGLNPTAGLVGLLYKLGVEHPWREQATAYCWDKLETGGVPEGVHTLLESFVFSEHTPEQDRAAVCAAELSRHFEGYPGLLLDPTTPGYGLTALQFVPSPTSRWRELFSDAQIDKALDHLQGTQNDDGGWPITWQPPSDAAVCEWRGVVTLQALRTLVAYGRISS